MTRALALFFAALLFAAPAFAVEPDEVLDDPALEERAREISKDIRCLVCQNQDIDSSNADLARDLRVLIRERLKEGDSNAEVKDFLVARYGEFVLLEPPMKPGTYLLWFGPFLILAAGAIAVFFYLRGRNRPAANPPVDDLDPEERKRLKDLLDGS